MTPFDAVYIINLPSRTDRREEMTRELTRVGIDPAAPDIVFFDAVRPADAGGFPSIGTRGCFMSHLGVLKAARDAGHGRILILEDDLNFNRDFRQDYATVEPLLHDSPWGMAYLGYLALTPPVHSKERLFTLAPSTTVSATHMLAFDAGIIPALIAYLEAMLARPAGHPEGGPMHVDGAYSWFRRAHPDVRTVLCIPELGYQRPSRTDIHELKWFDKTPVVRDVVALIRRSRARAAAQG